MSVDICAVDGHTLVMYCRWSTLSPIDIKCIFSIHGAMGKGKRFSIQCPSIKNDCSFHLRTDDYELTKSKSTSNIESTVCSATGTCPSTSHSHTCIPKRLISFKSCEMDYWLQIENCVTSSLCTFKCVADHIVRTIWEWHASKSFHFVFSKNAWTINEKKDDNYKFIKCSRQSPIEMGVHKISKMAHIRTEIGRWRWSTYYYDYLSKCI